MYITINILTGTYTENLGFFFRLKQTISELTCAYFSKHVLVQNLSSENQFDLHENESVGRTHFLRTVLH